MKRIQKVTVLYPKRSLDCVHYSGCLMEAAQAFLPTEGFSCSGCERYKQEKLSAQDTRSEALRALLLLDAIFKDEELPNEPHRISCGHALDFQRA